MNNKQEPFLSARERLTRYMEQRTMRKTPERYEVLRVVEMADGIFTIDELSGLMRQHAQFQVSRATLFNTMEMLVDAGIVIKHMLATAAHYELRTDANPKAYTICRQCGIITRVSVGTAKLALQNLRVRYFSREDTILYVHGLCRKCQARKSHQIKKQQKTRKQEKPDSSAPKSKKGRKAEA